jgi:hypothetical protein
MVAAPPRRPARPVCPFRFASIGSAPAESWLA